MKKIILFILIIFTGSNLFAQGRLMDSLKTALAKEKTDTGRINLLLTIGRGFAVGRYQNLDSSLWYLQQALKLSEGVKYHLGEVEARYNIGLHYMANGNYSQVLQLFLQNLIVAKRSNLKVATVSQMGMLSALYAQMADSAKGFENARNLYSLVFSEVNNGYAREPINILVTNNCMVSTFSSAKMYDSALHYAFENYHFALKNKMAGWIGISTGNIAYQYRMLGKYDSAIYFYKIRINYAQPLGISLATASAKMGIARIFHQRVELDSALFYARQSLAGTQFTDPSINEL